MTSKAQRLVDATYLAFPFRVAAGGPITSGRSDHVREQIEQVLFTDPMERIFRPHFGAGVRRLVFEPNSSSLWKMAHSRLLASLLDALVGEVDPKTLDLVVEGANDTLTLTVSYKLATVDRSERHRFSLTGGSSG